MLKDFGTFQTNHQELIQTLKSAESLFSSTVSVLITGETGTGKSILAQWIHSRSIRKGELRRVHALDAGELSHLQENDTVLIENVTDLSPKMQEEILFHIERCRAHAHLRKVRWISTSRENVLQFVQRGLFRQDLFFRLTVLHLHLPTLSERQCDLAGLAENFLKASCYLQNVPMKTISPEALEVLYAMEWRGNVTELENVMERALHLCSGSVISAEHIQFADRAFSTFAQSKSAAQASLEKEGQTLAEMERKLIFQTLRMTQQNKTQAAHLLGISIRTLRNKLNEYKQAGVYESTI